MNVVHPGSGNYRQGGTGHEERQHADRHVDVGRFQRHEAYSTNNPPISGPTTVVTPNMAMNKPM